ncbi:MAG: hypothetical protein AAF962_26860 [Actinomycetota bacterium]
MGQFESLSKHSLPFGGAGCGCLDGCRRLGDLAGDAVLFDLEEVERDSAGEVSSKQRSAFVVQVGQALGLPSVLFIGTVEQLGHLFGYDVSEEVGGLGVDVLRRPEPLNPLLDDVGADVAEFAGPSVGSLADALEVVVRPAVALVA